MIKKNILRLWQHFLNDSLFRNSIYLMLSTAVMGVLGFFFWILVSHLYSAGNIGLATSLISAASLMVGLSTLGLNNVLIRYLASSKNRQQLIASTFGLTAISSVFFSISFLGWAAITHSSLLNKWPQYVGILFVVYVLALTLNGIIDSVFISHRMAKYVLAKNTLMSFVKLALPPVFIWAAYVGLITVTAIATVVGLIFGCIILAKKFRYKFELDLSPKVLTGMRTFAAGNYIGGIFGMLPVALMPLIILSRLGPSQVAYYFIPAMVVTIMNVIPSATAQSLFAEASHDDSNLRHDILQALRNLFAILIPVVLLVVILAPIALSLFGHTYKEQGTTVLQILALSSLFGGMNYIGDAILNIQKRPRAYVIMNALNAILVVGLGYAASSHGLVAIALAILAGQVTTIIVYLLVNIPLMKRLARTY